MLAMKLIPSDTYYTEESVFAKEAAEKLCKTAKKQAGVFCIAAGFSQENAIANAPLLCYNYCVFLYAFLLACERATEKGKAKGESHSVLRKNAMKPLDKTAKMCIIAMSAGAQERRSAGAQERRSAG